MGAVKLTASRSAKGGRGRKAFSSGTNPATRWRQLSEGSVASVTNSYTTTIDSLTCRLQPDLGGVSGLRSQWDGLPAIHDFGSVTCDEGLHASTCRIANLTQPMVPGKRPV